MPLHWPRTREARVEATVLVTIALLFLAFLLPALEYAQREYRDGVRRRSLRDAKVAAEQWFNARNGYPLHPSGDLLWCGFSTDPDDWFFQDTLVRDLGTRARVRDPRYQKWAYRYCSTELQQPKSAPPLTAGFLLDTRLENRHPEAGSFNTEHNIFERTVTVDGVTHYQICGGTNTECGTER